MVGVDTSELPWQKARASAANGCVELAPLPDGGVAVRDSKEPAGSVLRFTRHEWLSFADGMSGGEFDHLALRNAADR
jgi:hypothetical protein